MKQIKDDGGQFDAEEAARRFEAALKGARAVSPHHMDEFKGRSVRSSKEQKAVAKTAPKERG